MSDQHAHTDARVRIADLVAGSKRVPRCPACGYDLANTTRFQCPECGEGFTLDDLVAPERPAIWLWLAWYGVCGFFTLVAVMAAVAAVSGGWRISEDGLPFFVVPASIGTLPMAAMVGLRFVVPGWREQGRCFFAKFFILLWPLLCPALWLLGASLVYTLGAID